MSAADAFRDRLRRNLGGEAVGVTSVCSAHPLVLAAALRHARATGGLALVEATCNQVNHEGGYTGQTPAAFRDALGATARAAGLAPDAVLLGGDHLGPNPWRDRPAAEAMEQARTMVAAYAAAHFTKLHLDASMACAGEAAPLSVELIADRAADLCAVAEAAAPHGAPRPLYVIGTEVPTPGGATEALDHVAVTTPDDLRRTVEVHRRAFARRGLDAAFARVAAVVAQPGVEFGTDDVLDYAPDAAQDLSRAVAGLDGLALEAHSTDYQPEAALRALVRDHFAILKVGPELTFALREAVFALDAVEAELLPEDERAGVRAALERAMLADPRWWKSHYPGDERARRLARGYSLSDRVRYYWPEPGVARAVGRLFANLRRIGIAAALVSQYLPGEQDVPRAAPDNPEALVERRINRVLARYARACRSA